MPELLAPAGDFEKMKYAFHYGADAIYCGGQNYSLRANAKNFTLEELNEAVTYAHNINKKIYVTVNIVFHDENLDGLKEYLIYLDKINIDGIIAVIRFHPFHSFGFKVVFIKCGFARIKMI